MAGTANLLDVVIVGAKKLQQLTFKATRIHSLLCTHTRKRYT